jgi:hypothetical protein
MTINNEKRKIILFFLGLFCFYYLVFYIAVKIEAVQEKNEIINVQLLMFFI